MLCTLGFDPNKNAYHTITDYLKEFETPDVMSLQMMAAFLQSNTVFHNSCIFAYNN